MLHCFTTYPTHLHAWAWSGCMTKKLQLVTKFGL